MILLFIFFTFLLIPLLKNKSVALILVILQLVSIGGSFFLGRTLNIETMNDYGLIFMMILLLFLIVYPWKYYHGIKELIPIDVVKLKVLTTFLIIVNSIAFVILLIITIIVQTSVTDINEFKYTSGVNENFIINNLPFPIIYFSIAIIFSNFSYFLLPLHFYYLQKKKYLLSLVCLFLSLNIVLIGLTYFSRAVVVQYLFLYIALLYMHYGIFTKKTQNAIRNIFFFFSVLAVVYFVDVSVRRFEEDASIASKYAKTIPVEAVTQDPLTFSFIDYMSQGYVNGFEVLQLYDGEGFNGAITFEKINVMLSSPYETYLREIYRQKLWPYQYSYSFTGFPAYAIYDYGVFGSILLCILYFLALKVNRPKNNALELKNVFLLVLLIQIPLMSIFYSEVGGAIIGFLLWILIWGYLRIRISKS